MLVENDDDVLMAIKSPVVLMALSCNEVLLVDEFVCVPC